MNVKSTYITKEEFNSYLVNDRLYEGFVIGMGYAYIDEQATHPYAHNSYRYTLSRSSEMGCFGFMKFQCIDRSPYMVNASLQSSISGEFSKYVIRQGDTLSSIAKELGISVNDITRWNDIKATDTIHPGQKLMIDMEKVKNKSEMNYEGGTSNYGIEYSEVLSLSFSLASVAIETKLQMENYKYLSNLASNGKFLGIKYGKTVVMDNGWLGTKRMDVVRGKMKSNFLSKVAKLKYLKWAGNVLGVATTGYSLYEFKKERNWENGIDSTVGIASLIYWPIGITYAAGKLMYEGQMQHCEFMLKQGLTPGKDDMMIMWK